MAQSQRLSPRPVNHTMPGIVEIEQMAERVTTLAISARKQHDAPQGHGEHQLRRDVACGKNKAYLTALRIAFADLRDGEAIDDVTSPLYTSIHLLESYAGDDAELAFEAYVKIEAEVKAEETRLEIEYLCGDKSTSAYRSWTSCTAGT